MSSVKLECQPENNIIPAANTIAVQKHGTHDAKCASTYVGTSHQTVENRTEAMAVAVHDPYATECSSSFADTTSEEENCLGLSDDAEIESQFYGSYDGFGSLFSVRKKKLTNHWRNFIQPLMWRCKWTGLKIKEFELQASKYNRKMVEFDQKKHMAYDESIVEEGGSKSLPFIFQNRKTPFKRRKRKRVEHNVDDVQSYMANHHLFSCCESKKYDPGLTSTGDDLFNPGQNYTETDDFGLNDDCPIPEINSNSEEKILGKIDIMYSRVHKLKSRLDTIMCKYAGKFSSSESLSHLVPCHSPTFSVCNGHSDHPVGGSYMPDYDCDRDLVLSDSSFGVAALIPDVIESSVGRVSSGDVTQLYNHIGDSSEKILDNTLIKNEALEMETVNETVEKHQDTTEIGYEGTSNPSGLTSCIHIPKLKRKRGERKAGAGGWCRQQSTAEPDAL